MHWPTACIARPIYDETPDPFLTGAVLVAALLSPTPAPGQPLWLDRDKVVEKLGRDYAEQPTAMGLASNGGVIELFTAADGATWTLVLTMPNGSSRLIAAGEGWEEIKINGKPL